MRKLFDLKSIATGVLIGVMAMGTVSVTASVAKTLQASYSVNSVIVDGKAMTFTEANKPFMVDGTTFLPVRAIAEAFNKDVAWDGKTETVTINTKGNVQAVAPTTPTGEFDNLTKDMIAGVKAVLFRNDELFDWDSSKKDNVGRTHQTGAYVKFRILFSNKDTVKSGDNFATISVGLMGDYKRLVGQFSLTEDTKTFKNCYNVSIMADEKEVQTFEMIAGMIPQELDINVQCVKKITAVITSTNDKSYYDLPRSRLCRCKTLQIISLNSCF